MKLKVLKYLVFAIICCTTVEAAYALKDGKLVNAKNLATLPAIDHYNAGVEAFKNQDWEEAVRQFGIVSDAYPNSPYAQDSLYYMAVAEYNQDEFEFANEAINTYLKSKNNPKYFQDAIEYKFTIAQKLGEGSKRRLFGYRKLPKWSCGKSLSLQIYDEVVAALPCHDLAARALYEKGNLQWELGDYRASVDAFQMLIKRFPKHELAPESYVLISQVYVEQSEYEFQNPDVLSFAQINLRRFKQDFPREERLAQAESDLLSIKEVYARGLYNTGQFYERTGKPRAAVIYYQNAIRQFPETAIANQSRQRLKALNPNALEFVEPANPPSPPKETK